MTTYYLLNDTQLAQRLRRAGELIDDTYDPITDIQSAGGQLVPTSFAGTPLLAAAATYIQNRPTLRASDVAQNMMFAAAIQAAIQNGGGGGGGGAWVATPLQAVNGGAFNLTTAMLGNTLVVDNTVAGRTVNLPAAPAAGFFCWMRLLATAPATLAVNTLTLVPNGAQAIEGVAANRVIDNGTGFFMLFWAGADGWRLGPINQNLVVIP